MTDVELGELSGKRTRKGVDKSISSNESFEEMSLVEFEEGSSAVRLKWENIQYTVNNKSTSVGLLKDVSGKANPGEVLAIMGSSGSGKTTLLNLLAGNFPRKVGHDLSGSIKANDVDIRDFPYSNFAAYVSQSDILIETLTIKEALYFSVNMRTVLSGPDKDKLVDKILKQMKLDHVADTVIGGTLTKSISGGQKKRLCIGLELIVSPHIILLDEPTSGLDSTTAHDVIALLKELAGTGKTVIMTIHQPSTQIFEMFDKLILMSHGWFLYNGDASRSRKYFAKLGFKCPSLINPPDYYMELIYLKNKNNLTQEELDRIELLKDSFQKNGKKMRTRPPRLPLAEINKLEVEIPHRIVRFRHLLKRSVLNVLRNTAMLHTKVIQMTGMSLLVVLIFNDLDEDYSSIQDRSGVLFFIAMSQIFIAAQNALVAFPTDRLVYYKEARQGLYGPFTFYPCKLMSEVPIQILAPFLSCAIIYWAVGLNNHDASKFFIFALVAVLGHLLGSGFGYLCAVLFDSLIMGVFVSPLFLSITLMFSGFFADDRSIPDGLNWLKYLSPFYYCYEALVINEFTDLDLSCDQPSCELSALEFLGSDGMELWEPLLALIIYTGLMRFTPMLVLAVKTRSKL